MNDLLQLQHGDGKVPQGGDPDRQKGQYVHQLHQPKLEAVVGARGHLQQLAPVQEHGVGLAEEGHAGKVDELVLVQRQPVARQDHEMVEQDVPGVADLPADQGVHDVVEEVSPREGHEHLGGIGVSFYRAGEEEGVGEVAVEAEEGGDAGVGEGHEDVQPPVSRYK